jgi:transcriptional regulator with XRE-family HTH domain
MPPVPPAQRALGLAVSQRRAELGLSQEAVSLRSDLHQRWISNVETGKRNPSYSSLRRLATALDLTTSELIALAETIEKQDDPPRPSASKRANS